MEGKMAAHMKRHSINIQGMACEECERRISKALSNIDGMNVIRADSGKGVLKVEYEPERCSFEHIKAAIRNIGYTIDETAINRIKSKIINFSEKK